MKGYRSDFDLLVVVNNNKLSDFAYWYKAKGRLERDRAIKTPTSFIVHSRRFAGLGRSWADKGPDSVAAHLTGAHKPATLDSNPDSLIQCIKLSGRCHHDTSYCCASESESWSAKRAAATGRVRPLSWPT